MIHLWRWFLATGVTTSVFAVYALAIAPFLEPPPLKIAQTITPANAPAKIRRQHDLTHLFAPDAWQLDKPKIIEAEGCLILFSDYKSLPDGKIDVTPCTVVMQQKDDPENKRPIVLDAPGGALLQFNKKLDLGSNELGEIQGAKLPGDIRIFQLPSGPEANDGLTLTTRNVQIDRQRVWTPHEVHFSHGPSTGSGRDLSIYLTPPDMISDKAGPIGNLQRLVLAVVDVMHLEQDGKGLLGGEEEKAPSAESMPFQKDGPQPPLEICCRGPFQFDFVTATGTFDEEVVVTRLNAKGPADTLHCDRLSFWLRKKQDDETPEILPARPVRKKKGRRTEDQEASPSPFSGELARIEATGREVILEAPSEGTAAKGARFTYDFLKRQIALAPGAGPKQSVTLRHGLNMLQAKQVEYELPLTGQLGTLWAEGPGTAQIFQEQEDGKQQSVHVHWEKEVRLRPDDGMKVLSLLGAAQVNASESGGLAADEIHFWLQEVPPGAMPADAVAGVERLAPPESGERKEPAPSVRPDRLLALGNVEINTPEMTGHTKRLEAWFVSAAPTQTMPFPAPVASPPASNRLGLHSTPRFDLRRTVPEDFLAEAADNRIQRVTALRPVEDEKPAAPANHFDITGELVRARLVFAGKTMMAEDLAVEGKVHVEESQLEDPKEMPVIIDGDILQLQKGSTPDATMQIVGQPAKVLARGLKLKGKSITVRRSDNKAWLEGVGEAELPLDASSMGNPFGSDTTPPPSKMLAPPTVPVDAGGRLPKPKTPQQMARVTWEKGAIFDGMTLTVSGKVIVRTEQDRQVLVTERLFLTFDQYVDFLKPRKDRQPKIAKIAGDGGVFLQNRSIDQRWQQTSFDQMQVENFTLDHTTGLLHADGPGWVTSTRVGGPSIGSSGEGGVATTTKQTGLTYLKVTFQGDIVGNTNNREITFQRQVRTIMGPIARWDEKFEPQSQEEHGDNGVSLVSEKLTIVQMKPGPQQKEWVELEAQGTAIVEGKAFSARAQRIAYSTAKEQLIMEGDGRSQAELWYTPGQNKPTGYQKARKITFLQKTGSIEVDGATDLELNNIGQIKVPGVEGLR